MKRFVIVKNFFLNQRAYFSSYSLNLSKLKTSKNITIDFNNTINSPKLSLFFLKDSKYKEEVKKEISHENEDHTSIRISTEVLNELEIIHSQEIQKIICNFNNKVVNIIIEESKFLNDFTVKSQDSNITFAETLKPFNELTIESINSDIRFQGLSFLKSTINLNNSSLFSQFIHYYQSKINLIESNFIVDRLVEINLRNFIHKEFGRQDFKLEFIQRLNNYFFQITSKNSMMSNNFLSGNFDFNSLGGTKVKIDFLVGKEIKINAFQENDTVTIEKVEDIENNSIFSCHDLKLKINPFLLLGVNIYDNHSNKNVKYFYFDKEGVSFCPTIIMNLKKEILINEFYDWKFANLNKTSIKIIVILVFVYLMIEGRNFEKNIYIQQADFKIYQLYLKKKIEEIEKKMK